MSEHYRGPWHADENWVLDRTGAVVARVMGQETSESEDEDRARLFAAAPELLAALEGVLPMAESWADGKSSSHPDHEWVEAAKAAIAMAEGIPR